MDKVVEIRAQQICKSFGEKKVLDGLSYRFICNQTYALTGANGAGKSTLLKILMGYMQPDAGKVVYMDSLGIVDSASVYRLVSHCSPYQQLPEELTVKQLYTFVKNCRPLTVDNKGFMDMACAPSERQKPIKFFSSGMKQRVKLTLAFVVQSHVLFLDEPTSNLDKKNQDWYFSNFENFKKNRIIILASNQPSEYKNFDHILDLDN